MTLDGSTRLGPNTKYSDTIDYKMDDSNRADFYHTARRDLPAIELDDLSPDFAGVRPKLHGKGYSFRDFVIKDEEGRGLPELINLIGIESPGLTSSPSIAKYVTEITSEILG